MLLPVSATSVAFDKLPAWTGQLRLALTISRSTKTVLLIRAGLIVPADAQPLPDLHIVSLYVVSVGDVMYICKPTMLPRWDRRQTAVSASRSRTEL